MIFLIFWIVEKSLWIFTDHLLYFVFLNPQQFGWTVRISIIKSYYRIQSITNQNTYHCWPYRIIIPASMIRVFGVYCRYVRMPVREKYDGRWRRTTSVSRINTMRAFSWQVTTINTLICSPRQTINVRFYSYRFIGKCIPVIRGGGVYQPAVDLCIKKLAIGEWVHIFPEGKVNMTKEHLRFKWGVGRMIYEAPIVPIIIPIWHLGMDDVLPNYPPYIFKFGKKITVNVGEPIDINDLVNELKSKNTPEPEARKIITDHLQEKMTVSIEQRQAHWIQSNKIPNCYVDYLSKTGSEGTDWETPREGRITAEAPRWLRRRIGEYNISTEIVLLDEFAGGISNMCGSEHFSRWDFTKFNKAIVSKIGIEQPWENAQNFLGSWKIAQSTAVINFLII